MRADGERGRGTMRSSGTLATASLVVVGYFASIVPGFSADLIWEVENPFRFFKRSSSFDMYE